MLAACGTCPDSAQSLLVKGCEQRQSIKYRWSVILCYQFSRLLFSPTRSDTTGSSIWCQVFNESVKAFEESLLSAAIGLRGRTLRVVCFRAFVPLSSLVCACGHARLFGVRACSKFGLKIVNTPFSFVVLNPLRSGKAAEDFVLPGPAL